MKYSVESTARFDKEFKKLDRFTQKMIKAWIEKNVLWIVIIIAALLLIPLIRGRIKKLKWEVSEYERGKIRK